MPDKKRVIVAGAGPVGLVAALRLASEGVPVVLLEAWDDLAIDLRASTFHPPTLDMLAEFGITQKLIDIGLVAPKWQFRDRETDERAEFDLGLLSDITEHPYRVQCEQHKLTRIIHGIVKDMDNVDIHFGTKLKFVSQTAESVTVTAERDGEDVVFEGAYLIGADGASSAVRIALDIGFEGITYPEMFVQASTPFPFHEHIPNMSLINYVSDSDEWFVLLKVPDLWRTLFPTREGEDEEYALSEEGLQKRLQGVLPRDEPYDIVHRTIYRIHQRVATTYRIGRICLAGDAAHLNNPLGGMGMNGGIHDAWNLTGKLLSIIRGEADEDVLDRYTRQRKPIALENVQAQAERNRQLLNERDPKVRLARFREIQDTATDPEKARPFLMRSSMFEGLRRAESLE